jgi:hypothetical protein
MDIRSLLASSQLSVITRHADTELARIQETLENRALVEGRAELEELFGCLLAVQCEPTPKTLDLIGHSTPGESLLQLGDWVIDASSPTVTAYFRELADNDVLSRLGIHAVRLLGCRTVVTEEGRWTACTLSDILGVEVYGTNDLVCARHYDSDGFSYERRYLLVCSSDLRRESEHADAAPVTGDPYPRMLDIDGLPVAPLVATKNEWPHRIATHEDMRYILGLVRRQEGATMPGLLTSPYCELAMPSAQPNAFHRAQILFEGEFLRLYPDGHDRPGVVYPVADSDALRAFVDDLPLVR